MHVPPIKGTAQVKFKVLDGTVNTDAGGKMVTDWYVEAMT